ncbi:hypothetical protein BJ165DRAFT_1445006 [Panaeolus papilionaceus]|nr:hypothetical protein BJ165DRAFT_1445006 [Panaeolus papilionaceus]
MMMSFLSLQPHMAMLVFLTELVAYHLFFSSLSPQNQNADAQDAVAISNEDDDDSVTIFEVEVEQDQQFQEAKIGFVKLLRAFLLKKNGIVFFK